jgi:ABC-type oligopeptide transport system substrate-binding subunit
VLYSFVGSPRAYDYSPLFHTGSAAPGKMNFSGFGTNQSDQEIEKAILSTSREEMAVHLKKLQQILYVERPIVFLYFEQSLIATSKRFPRLNISYYRPGYDPVGFYQTR